MSNRIELTEIQSHIVRAIEEDNLETPIKLIAELGFDKATFFKGSCFSGLDLRNDDLSGVNFDGTKLIRSKLLESQVKSTRQFDKTTFVDCEFYADTAIEGVGDRSEENADGQEKHNLDEDALWYPPPTRLIKEAMNALYNLEQAWISIENASERNDRIASFGNALKELKHYLSSDVNHLNGDLIQIVMDEINGMSLDLPDSVLALIIELLSACDNILDAIDRE